MNKKVVVIAAVLLLIVTMFLVSTAFNFGLGGTSPYDNSYDRSYSELKTSDLSDQKFAGFELTANSLDAGKGNIKGKAVSLERKIISTAYLQLEVDNIPSTVNKISKEPYWKAELS